MHRSATALFIAIVIALFSSCKSPNETHVSGVLLPLTYGNSWQYESHTISSKTKKDSVGVDSAFVTFQISFNHKNYLFYNFPSTRGENPSIMRNGVWGIYQFDDQSKSDQLVFQFPADNNETYQTLPLLGLGTMTVISNNETVTTPNRTYSCLHYRRFGTRAVSPDLDNWIGDFYFAPNVGLVKSVEPIIITQLDSATTPPNPPKGKITFVIDTITEVLTSYRLYY
jgi:hypothetical protein